MRQVACSFAIQMIIIGVFVSLLGATALGQSDDSREEIQRVQEVVMYNLNFFLDGAVDVDLSLGEVNWRISNRQVLAQMEKSVRDINVLNGPASDASFRRFSPEVVNLIDRVDRLSFRDLRRWRMAEGLTEAQQWYVMVQSALDELKMQVAMELNVHYNGRLKKALDKNVSGIESSSNSAFDISGWAPNSVLPPLEWTPSEATQAELSSADFSEWENLPSSSAPDELEEWLERMLRLLESQDRRLLELEKQNLTAPSRAPENWRSIDSDPSLSNLHLPESLDIGFSSGSSLLSLESKMQLHEIMELMGRYPQIRVMCTGHADASGERGSNLALSKRRAFVVQSYLLESGVERSRVLLNYFGEMRERRSAAKDRRVEVSFYLN